MICDYVIVISVYADVPSDVLNLGSRAVWLFLFAFALCFILPGSIYELSGGNPQVKKNYYRQ